MVNLILPLILIILQGLFNAGETGVMSIERTLLRRAKYEKKLWAIRTHNLLSAPERFFVMINLCDDLLLVIASTIFAQFFIEHFSNETIIFSTIILSLFSLVFGQFIPKSMALSNPEKAMVLLSEPLYFIEIFTLPIIYLFSIISKGIAHLFSSQTKPDLIRRSDIVYAMSEYEKGISKYVSRLFNFPKRTVAEVMIPLGTVFACKKECELDTIFKKSGKIPTRIPVYRDAKENIIGTLNIKDYFFTGKIILRKPFYVNVNDRCMTVFLTMKDKGEHMGIVRDGKDNVVGIITLDDLIEELVGEIRDEK